MVQPKFLHPDKAFIIMHTCDQVTQSLLRHAANAKDLTKDITFIELLEGVEASPSELAESIAIDLRTMDIVRQDPMKIYQLDFIWFKHLGKYFEIFLEEVSEYDINDVQWYKSLIREMEINRELCQLTTLQ